MKIKVHIFCILCLIISNNNICELNNTKQNKLNTQTVNSNNINKNSQKIKHSNSSKQISQKTHNTKNTKEIKYTNIERDHKSISKNPFVPIIFTPDGLNEFFENVYNKSWYAKDFLPRNFMHMTQFLQYGKNTKQNGAFLKSVIKLFSNKLKASPCISSYAFLDLIEIMPEFITNYFKAPEINLYDITSKKIINNLMYDNFAGNFNEFKDNPKIFLETVSNDIINYLNKEAAKNKKAEIIETHVNIEHLKQAVKNFLELAIAKVVWSPEDHKNIWDLFYRTAKALEEFHHKKIIDDVDNMDDIYWSLINRFCDLIDVVGENLPIEFYVNFNNKILSSQLLMFQIDEQEKSITSKETYLVQAILSGQAKAAVYQKGVHGFGGYVTA